MKKLNIHEMWKLYLLLKPALDTLEDASNPLDEAVALFEGSKPEDFLEVLSLLNDNISIDMSAEDVLTLFIDGLIANDFSEFVVFIEVLK